MTMGTIAKIPKQWQLSSYCLSEAERQPPFWTGLAMAGDGSLDDSGLSSCRGNPDICSI